MGDSVFVACTTVCSCRLPFSEGVSWQGGMYNDRRSRMEPQRDRGPICQDQRTLLIDRSPLWDQACRRPPGAHRALSARSERPCRAGSGHTPRSGRRMRLRCSDLQRAEWNVYSRRTTESDNTTCALCDSRTEYKPQLTPHRVCLTKAGPNKGLEPTAPMAALCPVSVVHGAAAQAQRSAADKNTGKASKNISLL